MNTPCGCNPKCFEVVDEPQRKTLNDSGKLVILTSRMLWLCQGCSSCQMLLWRVELSLDMLTLEFITSEMKGCHHVVCKAVFLRIHTINNSRLNWALKAQVDDGGSPHNDQRRCHSSYRIISNNLYKIKNNFNFSCTNWLEDVNYRIF